MWLSGRCPKAARGLWVHRRRGTPEDASATLSWAAGTSVPLRTGLTSGGVSVENWGHSIEPWVLRRGLASRPPAVQLLPGHGSPAPATVMLVSQAPLSMKVLAPPGELPCPLLCWGWAGDGAAGCMSAGHVQVPTWVHAQQWRQSQRCLKHLAQGPCALNRCSIGRLAGGGTLSAASGTGYFCCT